ncbi:MAG: hypothetical protein R3B13_06510 [Polyangiaceae bacterium]
MSYDEKLATRIRAVLERRRGVSEKNVALLQAQAPHDQGEPRLMRS